MSVERATRPPETRRDVAEDVLHGVTIQDPYRWLENAESAETQVWTEAQNAYARALLDPLPQRQAIHDRLDLLLTAGAVSAPAVRGNRFFYTRRDGRQDQPVLVLREGADGSERTLVDPNALSSRGVVALDWWKVSWDGGLLAYGTSQGGTELSVLRILDVASGEDVPGEEIPFTRACTVAWLPDASGFYYTRYPEPGTVPNGEEHYNRRVFFHTRGQSWRDDPEVFGSGRAREDWPSVDISRDGRWLLVVVSQGWARSEVYLLDRQDPHATWIAVHAGVEAWADGEIEDGRLFLRTNRDAPNYKLYEVDPERPDRERWRELIPERQNRVLSGFALVAGLIATDELENASSRLGLYERSGTPLGDARLPSIGTLTGIGGEWAGDALYAAFTSFVQPPTTYRLVPRSGELRLFAYGELPPGLDPSRYEVDQVWYPAKDGTRVSMFLVHRYGLAPSGDVPTLLTGYGGFNVSRTPAFDPTLPLWLDAGGLFALPNLRGGGEYGEDWHRAGMLERKQNVFDDFVAAAEWLIENHYTRPERLAIMGGSNGGLLTGAALTQRPDLFGAVVVRVPLLDMLRYHHLRIARLWVPEYGSAEDPEQFLWLHAYSPYHRVRSGERYPATFLLTAEGDSRVDPMHARKMAALLQSASGGDAPILLRVETEAGHGQGKPRSKVLDELTDVGSFIFWQLGVEPPVA